VSHQIWFWTPKRDHPICPVQPGALIYPHLASSQSLVWLIRSISSPEKSEHKWWEGVHSLVSPWREAHPDLLHCWPDTVFTTDINLLKVSSPKAYHQQIISVYMSERRSPRWQSLPNLCLERDYTLIWLGLRSYPTVLVSRAMNFFPKSALCAAGKLLWSPVETVHKALSSELPLVFDLICCIKRVTVWTAAKRGL